MPNQRSSTRPKPGFDYLVLADLIVVVCILVVASRPDGLAITISAAIVAAAAGLYRCTMGVKSFLKPKRPAPAVRGRQDRAFKPPAPAITQARSAAREKSDSWLRGSD
jgi:hypothetical protein